MTFDADTTERIRVARNAAIEEAAALADKWNTQLARQIRALKSHAPASTPAPTHGERIIDLIWAQLEDRPLGLVRAPEERKRDLAAAIDAALNVGNSATAPPPSGPDALDAAYRDMAAASSEQIVCAVRLALGGNQAAGVADDLQEMLNRANMDRATGLVAAAFSRLHAALAGKERP
jgi:hypothetical protein